VKIRDCGSSWARLKTRSGSTRASRLRCSGQEVLGKHHPNYRLCVCKSDLEVEGLKRYLKKHLPAYMIPNHFEKIDEMPLTPSGKADRKALPEPFLGDLISRNNDRRLS